MSEQQVAVIPPVPAKVKAIKQVLDAQADKIAATCAKYLDPQRLLRVAMATIYRTPELQECDPWSIANALLEAAQIGVEAGGPQDEAYLIPRRNKNAGSMECCFQVSYKGLIKIAIQTGAAQSVHTGIIYENDDYDYSMGVQPFLVHKPALKDRGKPIAAWCAGKLGSGEPFVDVMPVSEIEKRRKLSQQPNGLMWGTFYDEAAMKTVARHACKKLKGNPTLIRAIEAAEPVEYPSMPTELPAARPMPKRLSESKRDATKEAGAQSDDSVSGSSSSMEDTAQGKVSSDQAPGASFETDAWLDAATLFADNCKALGWEEPRILAWINSAKLDADPLAALKRGIEDRAKELAARRKK